MKPKSNNIMQLTALLHGKGEFLVKHSIGRVEGQWQARRVCVTCDTEGLVCAHKEENKSWQKDG